MILRQFKLAAVFILLLLGLGSTVAQAQSRVALVIGNAAYQNAPPLRTTIADAGLMAETLRAAGYDVTELTDLKAEDIGEAIREFLDKVAAGGPQTVAFFYYAGHAAQSGGENFLVPVDAEITGEGDIGNEAFRLSDMMEELGQMQAAARIVVIDGARPHGFGRGGQSPVSPGLAIMTAPPGSLIAFSAAPGAVVPERDDEQSLYATTLVTLMREPELDVEQIFKGVRVEVNKETDGQQTPWMVSSLEVEISLFDREAADPQQAQQAPQRAVPAYVPPRRAQPVQRQDFEGIPEEEAYRLAVEQDTLQAYQWFLERYPRSQYSAQVWEIVGTRREALLWRRALAQNTARGYWNYLRRYPNGVYAPEAQAQLEALSQPTEPPPNYVVSPEPLPPEYYDEGVDVPELVPEGFEPPPPVWGFGAPYAPYYVAPPPPRVVRPYRWRYTRPPPPPFVVVRPHRFVPRPPRFERRPPPRWERPPRPDIRPGVGRPGGRPGPGVRPPRPPRPGVGLPPRGSGPGVRPGVGRPGGPGVGPGRSPRPGVGLPPRGPGVGPGGGPGIGPGPGGRPPRPGIVAPGGPGQPPRSGRIPPGQPGGPPGRPPRPGIGAPGIGAPGQPPGQPPRSGRIPPGQPGGPVGRPPRPSVGAPPPPRPSAPPRPQPPRPQVQPQRPVAQPPRPQVQPPRPQVQPPRPQVQPQRPQVQPPRPQVQPPRPQPQPARPAPPQRPVAAPPRPAPPPRAAPPPARAAPQPQCPAGTRNVGGRCQR